MMLGISSCLVGANVRHDGKNKYNPYIVETLGQHIEFLTLCPEVAIDMGIPRPPIHLIESNKEIRAVGVEEGGIEVSDKLLEYGKTQTVKLGLICGYIFKSGSPSCSLNNAIIHGNQENIKGAGLYARQITSGLPHLPVIDENCLALADERDNFIERIFALNYWNKFISVDLLYKNLQKFHNYYSLNLMAHAESGFKSLSRLVSSLDSPVDAVTGRFYLDKFMVIMKSPATIEMHMKVLSCMAKRLADLINKDEINLLEEAIFAYEGQEISRTIPLNIISSLGKKYQIASLMNKAYLEPTTPERALRF